MSSVYPAFYVSPFIPRTDTTLFATYSSARRLSRTCPSVTSPGTSGLPLPPVFRRSPGSGTHVPVGTSQDPTPLLTHTSVPYTRKVVFFLLFSVLYSLILPQIIPFPIFTETLNPFYSVMRVDLGRVNSPLEVPY